MSGAWRHGDMSSGGRNVSLYIDGYELWKLPEDMVEEMDARTPGGHAPGLSMFKGRRLCCADGINKAATICF